MLGVTTATVNEWINSGKLGSFRTPGGHNRVREDLLLNFLKENSIPVPKEMDRHSRPRVLFDMAHHVGLGDPPIPAAARDRRWIQLVLHDHALHGRREPLDRLQPGGGLGHSGGRI